jgi:internalin A
MINYGWLRVALTPSLAIRADVLMLARCPHCSKTDLVLEEATNGNARCKECGRTFTIQRNSAITAITPQAQTPATPVADTFNWSSVADDASIATLGSQAWRQQRNRRLVFCAVVCVGSWWLLYGPGGPRLKTWFINRTPFPPDIFEAWTGAGATPGWVRANTEELTFFDASAPPEIAPLPGDVPGFRLDRWRNGVVGTLPPPQQPFALKLDSTGVTDSGLKELSGMCALHTLDLRGTEVTDTGLRELAELKGLRTLNLSFVKKVTDAGLKELASLKGLQRLYLTRTSVTDLGLKELAPMEELLCLDLYGLKVTNAGLRELARLKRLRALCLAQIRELTDTDLKELTPLKELRCLNLTNTAVTDAGLKELSGLPELRCLNLGATQVTDAGLMHLAGLKKLQALGLESTEVTDAGLQELQRALPKCDMSQWSTRRCPVE